LCEVRYTQLSYISIDAAWLQRKAFCDLHHHRKFRPQRDFGLRFDGVSGDEAKTPALGYGRESQHAFHPRKAFADALSAASAEREVDEAWAGGFGFVGEALGAEEFGLVPVLGGAMHDVLAEEEVRAGWNTEFAERDGLCRLASHRPCGRIEAHGFGEDHFGVLEASVVFERSFAAAEHFVDLRGHPGSSFRILREQIPGPGEGVGDGF